MEAEDVEIILIDILIDILFKESLFALESDMNLLICPNQYII
jgi:hypothetical protein